MTRFSATLGLAALALAACGAPEAPEGTPAAKFDAAIAAEDGSIPEEMAPGAPEGPAPSTRPRLLGWLFPRDG